MKIYKLELPLPLIKVNEKQTITTRGSFQSVLNQKNHINIYFDADDKKILREVNDFWFIETGKFVDVPKDAKYITTLSFNDGDYILHVYKRYVSTVCDYEGGNR